MLAYACSALQLLDLMHCWSSASVKQGRCEEVRRCEPSPECSCLLRHYQDPEMVSICLNLTDGQDET